jgi:hypothetical protein
MPLVDLLKTFATNDARYHERQSILGRARMPLGQSWVCHRPRWLVVRFKLIHAKMTRLLPIQAKGEMLLEGTQEASTLGSSFGLVCRTLHLFHG